MRARGAEPVGGMHARVGLIAGSTAAVLVFVTQLRIGIAALILVVLVGLFAGLSIAKWLPREWFGRQFEAGLRAGTLACALSAVGFLASLTFYGKHGINALAATSHLWLLDLGPVVRTLGFASWAGVGVVCALLAFGCGALLGALAAQFGGWDKNREAILAVERAREAAQRSARLAGIGVGRRSSTRVTTPSLSVPMLGNSSSSGVSDLGGLNESFYSLRSPISMVPPPVPPGTDALPPVDGGAVSLAPPNLIPANGAGMIDAASLVDSDPGATSAGMPIPQGPEPWAAFATWPEPELAPAPAPPPSANVSGDTTAPGGVILERDPRDVYDEDGEHGPDGADHVDDELPPSGPRQHPDTDSWLC